jgi:hypothetical protein
MVAAEDVDDFDKNDGEDWMDRFEEEVSLEVDSDLLSFCCRFYSADTMQRTKYHQSCLIFH